MQPAHPADSSLARAAELLRARDFEVAAHRPARARPPALAAADVLVIAHPSDPKWEATTGERRAALLAPPRSTRSRPSSRAGGGLIVLGETEQDKYGNNLNELLGRFGIAVENATVQDYEHHHDDAPSLGARRPRSPGGGERRRPARRGRGGLLLPRRHAGARQRRPRDRPQPRQRRAARRAARRGQRARRGPRRRARRLRPLRRRLHRRARPRGALAQPRLLGRRPAFATPRDAARLAPRPPTRPGPELKRRGRRAAPRPSSRTARSTLEGHDARARSRTLTETIAAAAERLAPHFPAPGRLPRRACRATCAPGPTAGFGKPDFVRSVEAFRPEHDRRDGIEHLASSRCTSRTPPRDTCFEALIVRVPWPEWIAELEAAATTTPSSSRSSSSTTPPATTPSARCSSRRRSPPPSGRRSHFGAIFCDREAERFRRVCGAAAEILRLNLPPDAAACCARGELSQTAYMLWDLIHDRTHMRGDLPFDPFMIRQRSPYWMYSLEELRCDLTAFGEAVKLEGEGFALARHVQYAILFDRLFRFPVTGTRVRNYDGLGGQLLFAFLHREGYLHWTDNRLTIDWDRLAEGVERLRDRVDELYHSGIDRSKLGQWIAAHDLVADLRAAGRELGLGRGRRDLPEVEEPKQLVDLVRDDEFPLSLFYTQLQPKLEPALTRPPGRRRGPLGCSRWPSLDGRVIAIAGAAGGLGPVGRRAARRRGRDARADRPRRRSALEPLVAALGSARRPDRRAGRRPARRRRRRRLGRARSTSASAGSTALLHLVGGWRGGEPIATASLDDYEWLHDLLVRTVAAHHAAPSTAALTASEHGRFVLIVSRPGAGPRRHQRRLRGDQGRRRELDPRARRRVRQAGRRRPPTSSSSTRSSPRRCARRTRTSRTRPSPRPRRSPTRSPSSAPTRRRG